MENLLLLQFKKNEINVLKKIGLYPLKHYKWFRVHLT